MENQWKEVIEIVEGVNDDCGVRECGWNRGEKCRAESIHIDKDDYPKECGE